MPKRAQLRQDHLRRAIAEEAARIMVDHGIEDFGQAKRKAAGRYGVANQAVLPTNAEIESAIGERLRLFSGEAHSRRLTELREAARGAMKLLSEFEPRLVGPVLSGVVTEHSDVDLHLFADAPESVAFRLLDERIPHELIERRVRQERDRSAQVPAFRFVHDDISVEATVFPPQGLRQAPFSPIDGKPMRRARIEEVERMLLDGDGGQGPK